MTPPAGRGYPESSETRRSAPEPWLAWGKQRSPGSWNPWASYNGPGGLPGQGGKRRPRARCAARSVGATPDRRYTAPNWGLASPGANRSSGPEERIGRAWGGAHTVL